MKTKVFLLAASVSFAMAFTLSCKSETDVLTDSRDGKKYKTVKIGEQVWMAENLNYEAEGSKCYGNDTENCKKYGRLYNWGTAMKACPKGWHLPDTIEWKTLVDIVSGDTTAGILLKASKGWNENGNGTDEYGFSALPGGLGDPDGTFSLGDYEGYWWSTTESEYVLDGAYNRVMIYNGNNAYSSSCNKSGLLSVRCVKD